MKLLIFTLFGYIFLQTSSAAPPPDLVPICKRNDPNLEQCLLKSLEAVRPLLIKGIPERDIPQLDPLVIDELVITDKAKTGIGLSVANVVATGAAQLQFSDVKFNTKDNVYEFVVSIPSMKLKGEYSVDGEILRLPIKGNGPFSSEFNGLSGMVKLKLDIAMKDGINQTTIKKIRIRLHVNSGKIKADNLFSADANIGKAINDIINDNFDSLSREAIPIIEKILEERIMGVASSVGAHLGYDKHFAE